MKTRELDISGVKVGGGRPMALIAGPCVIENQKHCTDVARAIKDATSGMQIPFIFKASFDKANRSAGDSFRGVGMKEGLKILGAIKRELNIPVLTDVHEPGQCDEVAEVVDVLQIPAFLCRQTDLLVAAGKTGKVVNVKKGQFLAPADMRNVVDKIRATDSEEIMLTERGTTFGYHYLINDMRALPVMRKIGYPVIFDATHSVQTPGGMGSKSGGERQFIPTLARAALAAGVDGIFLEVHPEPEKAPSDAGSMLPLKDLIPLLKVLKAIDTAVRFAVDSEEFESTSRMGGVGVTGSTLMKK